MANSPDTQFPFAKWSEILPGLWQGGSRSWDVVERTSFDSVYTLYHEAAGVGLGVKEIRYGIYDHDMTDFDPADLDVLVDNAHADWKAGKRVLIRCQAGLNRSGLVMALVLIKDGHTPAEAIALIREQRGEAALCNPIFEQWLLESSLSPTSK
jgi:protein-tyrosine phosphatase